MITGEPPILVIQGELMSLSDIVQLDTSLNGHVINLWTWFVAGNFAALAALFSVKRLSIWIRILFAVGFGCYAIGNLILIHDNLIVIEELKRSIAAAIEANPETKFKASLMVLANVNHPPWISWVFHLVVDAIIISIICLRNPE